MFTPYRQYFSHKDITGLNYKHKNQVECFYLKILVDKTCHLHQEFNKILQ